MRYPQLAARAVSAARVVNARHIVLFVTTEAVNHNPNAHHSMLRAARLSRGALLRTRPQNLRAATSIQFVNLHVSL